MCKVMYMVTEKRTPWFFCPCIVALRFLYTDRLYSDIDKRLLLTKTVFKAGGWLLLLWTGFWNVAPFEQVL